VLSTQLFNIDPRLGLLVSTIGGLGAAGLMYAFVSQFLIRSQASSEMRHGELVGMQGEITIPIGENATGQVTYVTRSGRMSSMARSVDGKPIPRGQFVTIVRTVGPQVLVKPLATDEGQEE
jgi:hypothetical protein